MTQFGILNTKFNCYSAISFDKEKNSYLEMDIHNKMNQPNLRLGHVRNSDTKESLTLIMNLKQEAFAYIYPDSDSFSTKKEKKSQISILKLVDKIESGWLDVQSRIRTKAVPDNNIK